MELLEVFYRRKLRKKQKKMELGKSDGALCRSPSEASVNSLATGLISKVLRFTSRRSEPASRPHSWHSTKLDEGPMELEQDKMDTMGSTWHPTYNTSASTTDVPGGFDSSGRFLRNIPDQYSSRGSLESLDPTQSSQLHSGAQHHHPLGQHTLSGCLPAFSSCHQLSSARSSNSIDHLNSKRDSAYSSFSTSSSIPECLASTPSFSPVRSYSLETVHQREGESDVIQQDDFHYNRTVCDTEQGVSHKHERNSISNTLLHNCDSHGRGGANPRPGSRDVQGSLGGVCYHGSRSKSSCSNRHSVGPIWTPAANHSSYESLKVAPAPPRRSDSYATLRNHERPNSWSSLEHARSLRSLQKGSWIHSSGAVASFAAKGSYGTECQLHTVIEKSPESSPTTKPRQGGGFSQLLSPPVYDVPQPEPSYTQIPTSNPGAAASAVYPALAKDSVQQHHQGLQKIGGSNEGAREGHKDGKTGTAENRQQNKIYPSSFSHYCYSTSASSKLRTQAVQADRPQQEESHHENYKPHQKLSGGQSESQTGFHRPHHQDHHSHSFQGSNAYKRHGFHNHEHNHSFHISQFQSSPGPSPQSSQEWRDHYTSVQFRGQRSRSVDQTSNYSDPLVFSTASQRQHTQLPPHPQPQVPPPSTSKTYSHHHNDSATLQYQHWDHREEDKDVEHPLSRLEIALAEVQQGIISDSGISRSSYSNIHSLSVLEKVNRFECQEHAAKEFKGSSNNTHNKATQLQMTERGHSTPCGAEDLKKWLEKNTKGAKAHRTLSYRGGRNDHNYRTSPDPSLVLQKSRSTFQLGETRNEESIKDFPQGHDIQEMPGPMQDTFHNRSYRVSLKNIQSEVLRSTSFRQRNLKSSVSPPAPAPRPMTSVPTKYHPLEKKGPKTMPKPQGIVILAQSQPLTISPHNQKWRHVVNPEVQGLNPPALPSALPVGPPTLVRICGRKRLMADQKKRSYSEPENLNKVGVSDTETAALFRRGGDTSVADRRRMFELGVSHDGAEISQNIVSRPDLRQLQHDAIAEYVERKTGDDEGKRSEPRPHTTFSQPDSGNQTGSSFYSEIFSLSSASRDSDSEQSFCGERHFCSTLPPRANLCNLQSSLFYPGRVTTPRPPAKPPLSDSSGSPNKLQAKVLQDHTPEASFSRQSLRKYPDLMLQQQNPELQLNLELSKQLNGVLQRAASDLKSGKSASTEDLLEQEEHTTPQHHHSYSSSTMETPSQNFTPIDVRVCGAFMSEPGYCSQVENRPADIQVSLCGHVSPQSSQNCLNIIHSAGHLDPGCFYMPATRREQQITHSNSTLAASGLTCPLFSSKTQDGSGTERQPGERLSLANLGAIAFQGIMQECATMKITTFNEIKSMVPEGQTRHSLTHISILEDTAKEFAQPPDRKELNTVLSSSSVHDLPVCLRISESSHLSAIAQQQPLKTSESQSQKDLDEVFLQNPVSLSLRPPVKETQIIKDPPPFRGLKQDTLHQPEESPNSELLKSSFPPGESSIPTPPRSPSSSVFQHPVLPTITSITTFTTTESSLGLEYQLLPKREKTTEDMQVDALAQQLVLQDSSLAPLLDTWMGKSTVELMEEIFPNSKLFDKLQWQHKCCGCLNNRTGTKKRTEINAEDNEKDLNTRKVELCEALRNSVNALRQEKELLCEEQKHHQALGESINTLLQEQLKTNEMDKYNMFIGDLEKIVSLLLSLCSRLSRIDKAMFALERGKLTKEDTAEERDSLNHKRFLLLCQTEDACELKENLDKRQQVVHAILSSYLTEPQLQNYRQFVSTKPSLMIRQRHLEDLIRQREEQITWLAESMPKKLADAHDCLRACQFLLPSPVPCSSSYLPLLPESLMPGPVHSVRPITVTSL
ncbi:protein Shroom3 isoform X2 [Echeneis naucrates]|uniref:protein Shroom3 isoform X2 n=1 Tax=Echeneis naucrates TaxID=173247 RepID=UPI0011141BA4|nr:protein Shroom3-like isoform X2 [Echeneis naucrates]